MLEIIASPKDTRPLPASVLNWLVYEDNLRFEVLTNTMNHFLDLLAQNPTIEQHKSLRFGLYQIIKKN